MDQQRDQKDALSALLAPPLMLMGSMIGHLKFHGYPLLSSESLILLTGLAGIGMIAGMLLATLGATNLRGLLLACILFFFVDTQFNILAFVHNTFSIAKGYPPWAMKAVSVAVAAGTPLIGLPMRQHIATICVAIFGAFILSVLIVPIQSINFGPENKERPAVISSEKPVLIHLILDGHIGLEGIPLDMTGGLETKAALKQFYEKWKFRLFGRAYSPYFMTFNSVGNMLNGVVSEQDQAFVDRGQRVGGKFRLLKNQYFKTVQATSRNIRVYQSDYIDYCGDAETQIEFCFTYPAASFGGLTVADIAPLMKARLILDSYFAQLGILRELYQAYASRSYFSSIVVPDVIRTMGEDILTNSADTLFFAHLLLPHGPYIWDSQCQIRPDARKWRSRRLDHEHLDSVGTAKYREKAYNEYFEQVHCVVQLLDNLFESMEAAGIMQNATIIVHGDHGSRITLRDPVIDHHCEATKRDYVDSFSTLFAIRSPDISSGYDSQIRSLPNLIAEYVLKQKVPMDQTNLYLRNASPLDGKKLMLVPMPDF